MARILWTKLCSKSWHGSIMSPMFFNIFINDLLVSLSNEAHGLKIGICTINTIAQADDISTQIPDMQLMIDKCIT